MTLTDKLLATPPAVDGLLLVDKPVGVSSHDVVSVARRVLGEKRIGHAGTLDPFATGLLVLLVGRATRLLQHLPHEPKRYEAVVKFGAETDTEDLNGIVTVESARPPAAALERAALTLVGDIDQIPPAYSAKRVDGSRAYKLARQGIAPVLEASRVRIESLTLDRLEFDDDDGVTQCRMRVSCGGGTYVRSLARDLARAAGSTAHLTALRRSASGPFSVADAVSLEDLKNDQAKLRPPSDALPGYPRQFLTQEELLRVVRGVDVEATKPGTHAALVIGGPDAREVLVAFAERSRTDQGDRWQPRVVMRES